MTPRGTLITALLAVEIVIVAEAVVAVRGGFPVGSFSRSSVARAASGTRLAEGGPHHVFSAGAHPDLTVAIGYADLTILTGSSQQIDVSVSPSSDGGAFRAKAPFTAREDGDTIRVATTGTDEWSTGDNRMVTVVVPANTRVTVASAGDIKATGLRAAATIKSVGSGSITVEDYDAPTLHATSKGPILLHQVAATRLDVTSSDDRIEGTALRVHDGDVNSSDRVTLGFAPGTNTLVTADASSGTINALGFSAGAASADDRKNKSDGNDSSSQIVRVGAGGGTFDVHADDGNVTLTQET